VLLVRTDIDRNAPRIRELTARDLGLDIDEIEVQPLPGDESGQDPLPLVRLELPPLPDEGDGEEARQDRERGRALRLFDRFDREGLNDDELVVTPDHWLHLSRGAARLCPAIEPRPTDRDGPWPPLGDPDLGAGVHVRVVDSGWHADAAVSPSLAAGWLSGGLVDGDPENNGQHLRPYAGHGTFIAGVIRCLAPAADVYVERFRVRSHAMRESDMLPQLREALFREPRPHLINLSAGCVTRNDQPLMGFERFWERHLEGENTMLVTAAGNDATDREFWPAATEWAWGVGSLNRNGTVSKFSNFGKNADIYAVGHRLVNAYPTGTYTCRETPNKGEERHFTTGLAQWSGTSFAAPVVVGMIAAELSRGGGTVHEAWTRVQNQAQTITGPKNTQIPALLPPWT
jgi:subtilisin family serine protease